MDDKKIIVLLEKVIEEKMLNSVELENAKLCIDILTNGILENVNNVRNIAVMLIKRAGLINLNNKNILTNDGGANNIRELAKK